MKIRTKVFLIVVVVFGMLFFGISTIFTNIETANFEKLERQSVKDNMSRVDLALEGRFDDLSVKLSDWSMWDDTYEFAEDRNAEYIESNLQSETLPQLRLNFILIKNSAGETIFEKYILNNQETPLPEDLERIFLNPRIEAIGKGNTFDKIAGIVNTENGPFILAVQSITSSDGSAIPKGYISFGFVADENFTASLSKATVLKLEHSTVENASKQPLFVEAKKKLNLSSYTYINEDPNEDVISGFVFSFETSDDARSFDIS
ncbi:MAG: Sensor diguanylate cyclase/phosphodiesterase, CHASE4 and PAS domain-containing [Candidatus Moranbacteria bacterium GW2011_GWD2_38_7]|nr:MAG: Sensor diguanylate cyclase/phosphodiesterase, CHASE4 and PAS domain-containing [Candidatus Moranbacteria bacterium GW2011_GWD2_38_7]